MIDKLFTDDGIDYADSLQVIHYNVTFLQDFGIFKKDDYYNTITVDYVDGTLTVYTDEGEVSKVQKMKLSIEE